MEDAELVALQSDLRNDIMTGVRKIARFIGESERRTYYLLEKGVIPAGKLGGQGPWIGSKRQIAAALQKVASGERRAMWRIERKATPGNGAGAAVSSATETIPRGRLEARPAAHCDARPPDEAA